MEMSPAELAERVGEEIGLSDWVVIDQPLIDAFAKVTDDHQFIHVDPGRAAAEGPYGTTVAHGLLTLALLPALAKSALPKLTNVRSSVNYGFDRVRFVAPVPVGARIRGRFRLTRADWRSPDALLAVWGVTVEIEGADRPALLADWLGLRYVGKEAA
ncbi:nodulation protein NodN [Haematobacter massiliensis]|uniref:Nodulation protein NodN n=1 Tax=Haematobacter massiliensis TaxID=195105 RepID=A0A086Y4N5_9RHOB|nr:MaoC family dehydratase [Haematobacter massiliensis]KFI29235.1 nodulation protein NodN [Haematobacter massiliensis]OWJ71954.1 nodulation protein NodN [Haematobacter massiliensis]OWJ82180.1 nodulation protein NodN [Haematobacter massiliensis]QBJ25853.1 MaoC family dehydratase [Haematobacter massiliensis]